MSCAGNSCEGDTFSLGKETSHVPIAHRRSFAAGRTHRFLVAADWGKARQGQNIKGMVGVLVAGIVLLIIAFGVMLAQ